jgi:hypothetical protein
VHEDNEVKIRPKDRNTGNSATGKAEKTSGNAVLSKITSGWLINRSGDEKRP